MGHPSFQWPGSPPRAERDLAVHGDFDVGPGWGSTQAPRWHFSWLVMLYSIDIGLYIYIYIYVYIIYIYICIYSVYTVYTVYTVYIYTHNINLRYDLFFSYTIPFCGTPWPKTFFMSSSRSFYPHVIGSTILIPPTGCSKVGSRIRIGKVISTCFVMMFIV